MELYREPLSVTTFGDDGEAAQAMARAALGDCESIAVSADRDDEVLSLSAIETIT